MKKVETYLRSEEGIRRERDAHDGQRLGSVLVLGPTVDHKELARIEDELGWSFPAEYVECVCNIGLAHLESYWDDCGPQIDARMLEPAEILEIAKAFPTWVEDCCSEFEDDPEGAAAEQAVRDTLVPFQFIGDGTSWNVTCFVKGDERSGQTRILSAYHDDEEMTEWDKQEESDRIYGLAAHLRDWLDGRGE